MKIASLFLLSFINFMEEKAWRSFMYIKKKKGLFFISGFCILLVFFLKLYGQQESISVSNSVSGQEQEKEFIKWVDFNVTEEALSAAYEMDLELYQEKIDIGMVELLAYTAAKTGGEFGRKAFSYLDEACELAKEGTKKWEETVSELKYYDYYSKAYGAVLDGFVGEFWIEEKDEGAKNGKTWKKKYGLKAFLPIAMGFPYSHYDDFGSSRSYGYKRPHLGHDMMGQVGTPIVAIESGYVEALGWNQYGGWRIGIRSFDKKRYYYYAHLRQNFPYNKSLKEGSIVTAGDVIGYMGHTGYSSEENVNNIKTVHLHWGLQLIFDESQKDGNGEIWIDCYQLSKFLYKNRVLTEKNAETKEWHRIYDMRDPEVIAFEKKQKLN